MIDEVMMLRHGRTQYNLEHRLQGQIDVPLDIVGQWQVDRPDSRSLHGITGPR